MSYGLIFNLGRPSLLGRFKEEWQASFLQVRSRLNPDFPDAAQQYGKWALLVKGQYVDAEQFPTTRCQINSSAIVDARFLYQRSG